MFPFSTDSKDSPSEPQTAAAPKAAEAHPLDALTGGVFSAATSGERAQRVRDWLATQPSTEHMQEVFKELTAKDKGAAKALRERLDELRRAKSQEAVAAEWEVKGRALLETVRLNIADALAWQRDAAKAGAPLSREPLAGLRAQLMARVEKVEDLQQRVMVQREAALLLAQHIELLSTKPLGEVEAQQSGLAQDVSRWHAQAQQLQADEQWPSVDLRFPPQIESAQNQLTLVWEAFSAALAQALAARADADAPLPLQPVWANELRAARGQALAAKAPAADKPTKPAVDPEQRAAAQKAVEAGVMLLEQAVASGHTKNMHSATSALRQSLKTHGRLIDDALEARVHAALVSAGELEGWQRWSADKVREQLLARAEALLVKRKIKGATLRLAKKDVAAAAPVDAAEAPAPAAEAIETVDVTEALVAVASPAAPAAADEQAATPAPVADAALVADTEAPVADTGAAEAHVEAPVAADDIAPAADAAAVANDAPPDAPQTAAASAEPASAEAPQDADKSAVPALPPGYELVPAMGGRKLQDTIRKLREEWKTADQGGAPNHALWKRFDRAITAAHKFVDEWITATRAEAAEHRAQREALIDEVKTWAARHASAGEGEGAQSGADWKAINRQVHQFSERWRNAGHLSEKQFAELQPRWKEAIHAAALPLETAQKQSTARRQALIAEAEALGAAPQLRIDAVKSLQQRWQVEAQAVPLERKHEQKLWDAFRKPIDDAFNRKSAEREKQQTSMSAHDKAVLEAAKALEAANASGDAQQIRAAMMQLEAATRGQAQTAPELEPKSQEPKPQASEPSQPVPEAPVPAAADTAPQEAPESVAGEAATPAADEGEGSGDAAAAVPAPAAKPAKPLIAVRGDDRPGAKKAEPAGRAGGKFGDRPGGRPGAPRSGPGGDRGGRFGDRRDGARDAGRFGDRPPREDRGPRLGDAAFRAQRDAVEHAQAQLRKLAAQAHGEALTQLLGAWQQRQSEQVPSVQELGRRVTPAVRAAWTQAIGGGAAPGQAAEALLRLEMAAEVPTPAEHLDARRGLQLQLLTRRNDPAPAQTWGQDAAAVLAAPHDDTSARRLQNALKALLRS